MRRRNGLPHWDTKDGVYFETFSLSDALPSAVLNQIEQERIQLEREMVLRGRQESMPAKWQIARYLFQRKQRELDQGYGDCCLKDVRAAAVIADTLKHFDRVRYILLAWCIMPNHVHALFRLLAGWTQGSVLHSWKSFSANECNRILGRSGPFWQHDSFDVLMRGPKHLEQTVRYIANNPSRAGLRDWRWVEVRDDAIREMLYGTAK